VTIAMMIAVATAVAVVLSDRPLRGQAPSPTYLIATSQPIAVGRTSSTPAASTLHLRSVDEQVNRLAQAAELQVERIDVDSSAPGARHERLSQRHRGVRVFGGDVVRQRTGAGTTVSVFGVVYPDIAIDTTPVITEADATVLMSRAGTGRPFVEAETELFVLPHDGRYTLTWSTRVMSDLDGHVNRIFIDAVTGNEVYRYDDTQTQAPLTPPLPQTVGRGLGAAGDAVKVSAQRIGDRYRTVDVILPGLNTTYDLKGDPVRAQNILNGVVVINDSDIAVDDDNVWGDGAIASTHAYASLTYLYFADKHNRRGINNNNLKLRLLANPARLSDFAALSGQYPLFFSNAAYYGNGYMAFGVGSPSNRNFAASIDVVAHEIVHGLTAFTSGLIYLNQSGALNESFSDMMGAAVEFEYQQQGGGIARADWLLGEDVRLNGSGLRSFVTPSQFGHPDHWSLFVNTTGDNGGVHTNSSIMNHVFYLAIQGGTHRLSGQRVEGVGLANRLQIERAIFRAFTTMLPAGATFSMARASTIQAARDLYGVGSAPERALIQTWDAVGVQ
jgi:Zn-dependent metalloprotease